MKAKTRTTPDDRQSRSEAATTARGLDILLSEPPVVRTVAELVAQRLRELIVGGHLPAGSPLRLAPLASRLGVSIMPVRDALRLLEADHLVVLTPRRGAVVADLSVEDAEEIYAVRVALESLCARHAMEQLTEEDIEELDRLFHRMEKAQKSGDVTALIESDHEFHSYLYARSNRTRLVRSITDLVDRSRRYVPYLFKAWEMVEDPAEAHRPLMAAIRARDPGLVERLTREHMEAASARVLAAIRSETAERRHIAKRRSA